MSNNGTWSGNIAVEPLSNADSSGSCDSVISVNSGCSDDSMEHLSPEERACLMYLEETIEALEAQEDSGLSNDEPDAWPKAERGGQMRENGISSLTSASGSQGMSPPLAYIPADPAPKTSTTKSETKLNQRSEVQSAPASAAKMKDLQTVRMEAPAGPPLSDSAAGCVMPSAVNTHEVQSLTLNGDYDPENVSRTQSCAGGSTEASEIDLTIIPPPSDFMDELYTDMQPEKVNDVLPPAEFSTKPEADVELEQPHSTDSVKKTSAMEDPPFDPPQVPPPVLQFSPSPEFSPPKSPPVVAPKPKNMPANICLNSQKTATAGSDGSSHHAVPAISDQMLLDPQKVRMEALRKLGLLKTHEEKTGFAKSPSRSPKSRQSWAGPSPPTSPGALQTPQRTPSYVHVGSPPAASAPLQSAPPAVLPSAASTSPPSLDPEILPAPPAFGDPTEPLPSNNELPAGKELTGAAVSAPPLNPPVPVMQLTPSAAPDHPGVGLSTYTTSHKTAEPDLSEQSPRQLHRSRPRPASLGSGNEFSHAKAEDMLSRRATSNQPDSHRPLPAHSVYQHSRETGKLPRSQGISVMISPRAEKEEDRRKALKKLGLLRE